MYKILLNFLFILFLINVSFAQEFKIAKYSNISDIDFQECNYDLIQMITDYDLSQLNDEAKLDKVLEYVLKLSEKYSIEVYGVANMDKEDKCYAYLELYRNSLKEVLDNIKSPNIINSDKYNLALFLYYLSKNGLYEFDTIKKYSNKLSSISQENFRKILKYDDKEISNLNTQNLIDDIYRLINFINTYGSKLNAAEFLNKLLVEDLYAAASFQAGRFDIFNMKNDIFAAVIKEGSIDYYNLSINFKQIDEKILKKYLSTYSKKYNELPAEDKEYYISYLDESVVKSSDSMYKLYIIPLMGNVYIAEVSSISPKFYNILLYQIDNVDRYNRESYLYISNMDSNKVNNFPYGKIDELKAENLEEIPEELVYKKARKSKFVKNGELDVDMYSTYMREYFSTTHGMTILVPSKYYKFDINNDGKKELLGYMEISSSKNGETGTYTVILNEKTLEVEYNQLNIVLENFMGLEHDIKSIVTSPFYKEKLPNANIKVNIDKTGTGLIRKFYQKLYTYNGKNKIALIEENIYGIFIDVLDDNNKLDILSDYLYSSKNKINTVWKGSIKNGRPDNLLHIMPSFDISKASTLSEKEIVNDINLRMLDNLSSKKYFKSIESASKEEKAKLLNERRLMNKKIKSCNGNNQCIKDILYNDVF